MNWSTPGQLKSQKTWRLPITQLWYQDKRILTTHQVLIRSKLACISVNLSYPSYLSYSLWHSSSYANKYKIRPFAKGKFLDPWIFFKSINHFKMFHKARFFTIKEAFLLKPFFWKRTSEVSNKVRMLSPYVRSSRVPDLSWGHPINSKVWSQAISTCKLVVASVSFARIELSVTYWK